MKIALYDIGTNSIHMKIVDLRPDLSFDVLYHEKDMTRIGDGSFSERKLTKKAMRRALKVLERFSSIADKEDVSKSVVVATSAVRDARNSEIFIKSVLKKTGLRVRVISGEEEARLIFLGAASGIEMGSARILTIDIGGGSIELVLGDQKKIYYAESFELGVARLRDRFTSSFPVSKKDLRRLQEHIEDRLKGVSEHLMKYKFSRVIGTAGTFINLASAVYERREKRRFRLRGFYEMKTSELKRVSAAWPGYTLKKLEGVPGFEKKRADTVVAGATLVKTLLKLLKTNRISVSDKGIREGLLIDFIVRHKLKIKDARPPLVVQWFGQKPFFSGKIMRLTKKSAHAHI